MVSFADSVPVVGGPSVTCAMSCWLCSSSVRGRFPCRALTAVLVYQWCYSPLICGLFVGLLLGPSVIITDAQLRPQGLRKRVLNFSFQTSVLITVETKYSSRLPKIQRLAAEDLPGNTLSQELIRSPEGMFGWTSCSREQAALCIPVNGFPKKARDHQYLQGPPKEQNAGTSLPWAQKTSQKERAALRIAVSLERKFKFL